MCGRLRCSLWSLILVVMGSGCQQIEPPRTELTQNQWRQVQEYLLDEAPEPDYPIGVVFGESVELVGLSVEGDLRPGQEVTATWYWRVLADVHEDWQIFVHFDAEEERFRQNLDHYPLGRQMSDVYRTYHWQEGQVLADEQVFEVREDFPAGEATFFVGLFRGERRSPVTSGRATDDHRAIGPTVAIEE